jgi:hypothetical protein
MAVEPNVVIGARDPASLTIDEVRREIAAFLVASYVRLVTRRAETPEAPPAAGSPPRERPSMGSPQAPEAA